MEGEGEREKERKREGWREERERERGVPHSSSDQHSSKQAIGQNRPDDSEETASQRERHPEGKQ